MRKALSALAAVMLIGFSPLTAHAQDLASICETVKQQAVGGWAKYQTSGENANGTMRLALLSEGAGGAEGTWFEMSGTINGQDATLQLLADTWPFEAADIKGMVIKAAGQPAMRMPESMMSRMRSQMDSPVGNVAESCAQGELLGSESIEVPAGTFETYKIKPGGDIPNKPDLVWINEDVPFGVVKSEGSDGTMVLLEYGDGAESSITEEPQAMPGMPGMQ